MSIAKTILEQLGGNRFVAMTGAKNFGDTGNGLAFQVPASLTKNRINAVKVVLDPSDTYTVKFLRITSKELKTVSQHSMIYCDQLKELFESETGLLTHL
jgi:hypothetical protein